MRKWIGTPLAVLMRLITAVWLSADAEATHQTSAYKCVSNVSYYGFNRWHSGSSWNWCYTDSYGPPEWMYWNYYPGTPGYDNPSFGPYLSLIQQGISDWGSVQPGWKATWKSGDWSTETDLFIWQANLDSTCGAICRGYTPTYYCSSPSSCVVRNFNWSYNLSYVTLDTTGVDRAVLNHEFGHAYALKHPTQVSCTNYTIMDPSCINYYPYMTTPNIDDSIAVDAIYPEGSW
ncbi:MAG: hypothetical protein IT304_06510 [Dehalococcoidia bacterium]|nr:hypothetical protein [Dehalococcoidia bacterium]